MCKGLRVTLSFCVLQILVLSTVLDGGTQKKRLIINHVITLNGVNLKELNQTKFLSSHGYKIPWPCEHLSDFGLQYHAIRSTV